MVIPRAYHYARSVPQKPIIIVGTSALQGPSAPGILKAVTALAEKLQKKDENGEEWKVFNVLHKLASQVS